MSFGSRLASGSLVLVLILGLLSGCGRGGGGDQRGAQSDSTTADSTAKTAAQDEKARSDNKKGDQAGDEDQDKKSEAVPVDIAVLTHGSIEAVIRASANLEAESQVAVLAEASRRVTELLVEEGDVVRKGEVLLRLQDAEQKTTLARTRTLLEQAQREYERQSSLAQRDLTTQQALQDAQDELERQKLALEDAERELSYTEVRAPISGTVTRRMVNLGNQVQMGQQLFDIVDFESLVALIYVPEKNLKELREQQDVRIWARAVSEQAYQAQVKRVAPVVDPRTGTVKVTVDVGGQQGLRPGLYVDVELITTVNPNALLIPKRALVYDNDQIFLFRLKPERKVERALVVPALSDKDHVTPLQGFAAGDTVIIAGQAGLKEGSIVSLPGDEEDQEEEVADETKDTRASALSEESGSP